jgi:ABC-type transporter Mla maintaining outer membrane lipid asymmetry permease subunit MlaE
MTIFGKLPAFWIGLVATIVVGVITTLNGNGIISDVDAGKVKDTVTAIVQLLTLLAPLLAGLVIHTQVTPTSAPTLPMGTSVTTPTGAATVTPTAATIPNPAKS